MNIRSIDMGWLILFSELLLCLWQKVERRALVESDQTRAHIPDVQCRNGTGVASKPLELVERQTDVMRHCQFDRIRVEDTGDDILRFMFANDRIQRSDHARLTFVERLAFGELRARRRVLDDFPMLLETKRGEGSSLPFTDIRLDQPRLDLDLEPACRCNGHCRLLSPLQRTRIDGFDRNILQYVCQLLCLFLSAFVQVDIRQMSREFVLFREVVFAVTDQEQKGHNGFPAQILYWQRTDANLAFRYTANCAHL